MKSNRKGNIVLNTMAKAIIGLALLLVISTILFLGDNSLFPKVKQLVPRGDQYIPKDYQSSPSTSAVKQLDNSKNTFEDLYQAFKSLATVNNKDSNGKPIYDYCFATVDGEALSRFHDERAQKMLIRNNQGNIEMELLGLFEKPETKNYLANGKLWSLAYPLMTIEGAQLCIVGGKGGQAQRFFDAWMGEQANAQANNEQYRPPAGDQIVTYAWNLYEGENWLTEKDKLQWESRRGANYLLFMHEEGGVRNVCIFPTQKGWRECEVRDQGYLDNDCFAPYKLRRESLLKTIEEKGYLLLNEKGQCTPGGR